MAVFFSFFFNILTFGKEIFLVFDKIRKLVKKSGQLKFWIVVFFCNSVMQTRPGEQDFYFFLDIDFGCKTFFLDTKIFLSKFEKWPLLSYAMVFV